MPNSFQTPYVLVCKFALAHKIIFNVCLQFNFQKVFAPSVLLKQTEPL